MSSIFLKYFTLSYSGVLTYAFAWITIDRMRKAPVLTLLGLCCIFLSAHAFAENSNIPTKKTRDRANKVMSTLLPGPPEIAYAVNNPSSKTAAADNCPRKTNSRLEKGIASVMGGVWQLATFWCPESDCSAD
jgi:hypothetical protein